MDVNVINSRAGAQQPDIYGLSFNRRSSRDRDEPASERVPDRLPRDEVASRLPKVSKKLNVGPKSNSSKDVTNIKSGYQSVDREDPFGAGR